MTAHRSFRTALAAVALLAATAACSNESPAPPVAAPTTSTSPQASSTTPNEPAPLEVYRDFWAVINRAYADPTQDWTAEVERVAADPARTFALEGVQQLRERGIAYQGRTQISPEIESLEPIRAVINDCVDITESQAIQRGETLAPAPDQLQRYRYTAVVVKYENPNRWLVSETQPRRGEPC